jgi:ankyrin repeat protein
MTDSEKLERLIKSILAKAPPEQLEMECVGLDLNQVGMHGRTPLQMAAAFGTVAAVDVLIRKGASLHNTGRRDGFTALHEASIEGNIEIAKYLLSLGAGIDAATPDGTTPLMCAAAWANNEVVKLLLKSGADRTKTNFRGDTAADCASEKCEDETADLIKSYPTK